MQMVTAIDNMIFTLLHKIQRLQVFSFATMYKTPIGSNAQQPTLYPGCTCYNEVFCECVILGGPQLGIT